MNFSFGLKSQPGSLVFFRIPACVRNTMWPREVTVDICESKLPITSYNSPQHPIASFNKLQLAASFSKDSSRPCSSSRSFSIKHGVLCQQGASRDARESGRLKGDWKRIRGGCDPIESIYCNWLHKLHILLDISGWCSTKYLDIFKISSRYDKYIQILQIRLGMISRYQLWRNRLGRARSCSDMF